MSYKSYHLARCDPPYSTFLLRTLPGRQPSQLTSSAQNNGDRNEEHDVRHNDMRHSTHGVMMLRCYLQHARGEIHDLGEHRLAAEATGESVQGALRHHGVTVIVLLLQLSSTLCQ